MTPEITPKTRYAICCTQRCGSHYLCKLLHGAGLGFPGEYYYPESLSERIRLWTMPDGTRLPESSSAQHYFEDVMRSQGEIAGVKLNWQSLLIFIRDMGLRPDELGFRLIYLTRRDKLRQAISWYRAVATNQWTSLGEKPAEAPPFDWAKINGWLQAITLDEARWEHYFQKADAPVMRLIYEDMHDRTVPEIAGFLGCDLPHADHSHDAGKWAHGDFAMSSGLQKMSVQRDELTDQWVDQFIEGAGSQLIFSKDEIPHQVAAV